MKERIDYAAVSPTGLIAMRALDVHLKRASLGSTLLELVKVRASQLNGCAYCINMHTSDARALGESEHRLYTLAAWRETPFFTLEEKAILALTEEVTLISNGVTDETYKQAIEILGEQTTAQVILAAVIINAWNRIGVSTRMVPQPAKEVA